VANRITLLASRLGGRAEWYGLDAPEFPFDPNSSLLREARVAFLGAMGYEPETLVSNCSLELGMFIKKLPGLDTISVGTEMSGMHSVSERVSHPSISRVWAFAQALMQRLATA
jgi:dipeptidase D